MKKSIIFNLQVPGFHRWENAPDKYKYLSAWHRHVFHIKCEIEIENNRQLEIIEMKEKLYTRLMDTLSTPVIGTANIPEELPIDFCNHIILDGDGSCELLAEQIAAYLYEYYNSYVEVTVLEDGENGAKVGLWHDT